MWHYSRVLDALCIKRRTCKEKSCVVCVQTHLCRTSKYFRQAKQSIHAEGGDAFHGVNSRPKLRVDDGKYTVMHRPYLKSNCPKYFVKGTVLLDMVVTCSDSLWHLYPEPLCPGQKEQHFPEAVKRNESKVRKSWSVYAHGFAWLRSLQSLSHRKATTNG